MRIIDAHCGIGPWQKRDRLLPYRPEEILNLLDHFGIQEALAYSNYAVGNGSAARGNRLLVEACRKHPRLRPAFTIFPNPHDDQPGVADQFAEMRGAGGRAARLCPPQVACEWVAEEIYAACAERRVPLFLDKQGIVPDDVHRICREFPGLRLVLTGVGYGEDWWLYPLLRRHENIYVCLGHFYIPSNNPMRFLRHFPAERMIFGSGLPHFSPGGLIAHLTYADISEADRDKILFGNIERLLSEAQP